MKVNIAATLLLLTKTHHHAVESFSLMTRVHKISALQGTSRQTEFQDLQNENRQSKLSKPDMRKGKKKKKGKRGEKNQDSNDDNEGSVVENEMSAMKTKSIVAAEGEQPEVSMLVEDEETGMQRVAEGKSVLDVTTGQALKLSDLGPEYRLAEMFPGVPPNVREELRFDYATVTPDDLFNALQKATALPDPATGEARLPKHPQVTDLGLDFVIANRDMMGKQMTNLLGRLKLRNQWKGDVEMARYLRALTLHHIVLENKISAPFRQIVLDAELKIGPNFGSLDVKSYVGKELYERCGAFIVFKAMVALWEKRVVDAQKIESTPKTKTNFVRLMCIGDPHRYLPENNTIWRLEECAKICAKAQQMSNEFTSTSELYDDLPPELRFMEEAMKIETGGKDLRRFMIEEFCPRENITPEALREGLRRVYRNMENMQQDPYGELTRIMGYLLDALSVGSPEERNIYEQYEMSLTEEDPGYFETYTFEEDKASRVAFLDGKQTIEDGSFGPQQGLQNEFNIGADFFGTGESEAEQLKRLREQERAAMKGPHEVPEPRAVGRSHELGWFDLLNDEEWTGEARRKRERDEKWAKENGVKFEADDWEEL